MGIGNAKGLDTETIQSSEIPREERIMHPDTPVVRLDLACGNNKKEGFVGLDIVTEGTQADFVCDLFEKSNWKVLGNVQSWCNPDGSIKDNSIFEVRMSHFIEHVPDLVSFANELYRIMVPGGRVYITAPYYSSIRAMQDPTHKQFISEATFLYWMKPWREMNGLSHYEFACDFRTLTIKYFFNSEWRTRAKAAQEWARKHYINVVDDIEVTLEAIK